MLRTLLQTYRAVSAFRYYSTDYVEERQTIYALSSGQGKCGVAVVRVSGNTASIALKKLVKWKSDPKPKYAYLKYIHSPDTEEIIDKGLVLWFPAPRSFTGEDICEFQVHGGPAVVSALLEALSHLPNYRMARPGEFTRRAFDNGKIDLVEAEGLADLINAETEFQRQQAFMQTEGVLSKMYNNWKNNLNSILSKFEAQFNFELEQAEDDSLPQIAKEVLVIYKDISKHLDDGRCGEKLRTGVDVVIAGEPNVGKSSLYNALCQRSAAIVTPHPGTTRDVLDVQMDIGGYPVTLYDTCGIHVNPNVDPVEAEGIVGAKNAVSRAQLLILMVDATKFNAWKQKNKNLPVTKYIAHYLQKVQMTELMDSQKYIIREFFKKPCIVVMNKCDRLNKPFSEIALEGVIPISILKNKGLKELVKKLTSQVKSLCSAPSLEYPVITKIRHRALLEGCREKLKCFVEETTSFEDDDDDVTPDYGILGNYLREAIKAVTEIVDGKLPNEPVADVLDNIFAKFCIGK